MNSGLCYGVGVIASVPKPLRDNASRRNQRVAVSRPPPALPFRHTATIAASRRVQGVRSSNLRVPTINRHRQVAIPVSVPVSVSVPDRIPPPQPSQGEGLRAPGDAVVNAGFPPSAPAARAGRAGCGGGAGEGGTPDSVRSGVGVIGSVSKPLPDNASRRNQRVAVSCSPCDQLHPHIAASRRVQGVRSSNLRVPTINRHRQVAIPVSVPVSVSVPDGIPPPQPSQGEGLRAPGDAAVNSGIPAVSPGRPRRQGRLRWRGRGG